MDCLFTGHLIPHAAGAHAAVSWAVPSYQLALMGLLLGIGLLLNLVSYRWMKDLSSIKTRPAHS